MRRLDLDDPASCLTVFRSNRDAGLIPVLFLAVAALALIDPVRAKPLGSTGSRLCRVLPSKVPALAATPCAACPRPRLPLLAFVLAAVVMVVVAYGAALVIETAHAARW